MQIKLDPGAYMPTKAHRQDAGWENATCPVCGKKFHLKPSKLAKDKHHYCSRTCHIEAKKEYMKGEKNHQYGITGEKNASWKNGRRTTKYGYYMVYAPGHPFSRDRCVLEHRLIAEKYLLNEENSIEINGKRYLSPNYVVHHIDFDRKNNDPDNLVVMTKEEHQKLHATMNLPDKDPETGRFKKREVPFVKVVSDAKIPTLATEDSAGYDMYAQTDEPIIIKPHKAAMIRSGVAMSIPKGYAGFVFARSGLAIKKGLRPSTCVSVIDADYRGEIGLPIRNDSDEDRVIKKHDRIAQIVFMPILNPKFELVESLDETERGENGFGSSGL